MRYSMSLIDETGTVAKFKQLSNIRMEAVIKKQVAQLLNKARHGYTPFKTGELRLSASSNGVDTMFYTKSYAPHVEYGHRIVRHGRQVGYVNGQHYLRKNIKDQEPVFFEDVRKQLERLL